MRLSTIPPLLLSVLVTISSPAAETLVLPYNQTWAFLHPMGTNPGQADPNFDSTWWLTEDQFVTEYDGPSFTNTSAGSSSNITTINSGTGPGPLGYNAVDNFLGGNPLLIPFPAGQGITALGTTLTTPVAPHRKGCYYRTTFTTFQTLLKPIVRAMMDDGCVIFLDGIQVARLNLADHDNEWLPFYSTTALGDGTLLQVPQSTENTLYQFDLSIPGDHGTPGGLRATVINPVISLSAGTHTLAVFLCSFSHSNSDQLMALQITAQDAGIDPQATAITRNLNGTPTDPADDTFEFDVSVTPLSAGASGWASDSTQHPAGNYIETYHFAGYPAAGAATVGFNDIDIPSLTSVLTVAPPPPPLWIGQNELPGDPGPLLCTADINHAWVQAGEETIQHNNGNGAPRQILSTPVVIPPAGAAFSAMLEFEDSSTTDNFESTDSVQALLSLDDGTNITEINLLPAVFDANSDGLLNGYTGPDYNDNRAYDELNLASLTGDSVWTEALALSHQIPAGTLTAQLIVRAANDAVTETFRVRSVRFTTAAALDSDGDNVADTDELAAGTDPFNPASHLAVTSTNTPGGVLLTFPSVTGRTYRIMSSDDLVTWGQENFFTITGDGSVQEFPVSTGALRKYFSLQARRGLHPFP